MSLISRILEHSRNARVPRARDPETHEPIPYGTDAPALVKIGAKILSTSWASRMILKWIAALGGFMTTFLIAKGAGEHTPVIVGGVLALATFLYEQLASYLSAKASMKIPPRVGGQSLTSNSGPSFSHSLGGPSGSGSSRSEMFKAIIAKPTSPAEDETALLDLRASMVKPPVATPTEAEIQATRAKLYGFSVEVDGEVHDFLDKFKAIQFRDAARLDGKRATLLF